MCYFYELYDFDVFHILHLAFCFHLAFFVLFLVVKRVDFVYYSQSKRYCEY